MRAKDRIERGIKPVQVIVTEEQHKRLRIRAAMDSTNVSQLIRARLIDIMDPMGAEDADAIVGQH
jgi:hypothetical protein